jgi:N6-adenosine-specific RNA methylase IME4
MYRTIVADPPWRYADKLRMGDHSPGHRGADSHYQTMALDAIKALPVADLAEMDGCHLYLWTTNAFLVEAHEVARAWGFRPRTVLTWVKTQIGMGSFFRNNTEHVIFAVRGSLDVRRHDVPTAFTAPRRAHSAKPECFLDLVEQVSPGPYVELFSRRHRLGWDTWGNESANTAEWQVSA